MGVICLFKNGCEFLKKFFAVDRAQKLTENTFISLTKYSDVNPRELQIHVDELYPHGVSVHGERYLINSNSHGQISSPAIELLFEYVRKAYFPEVSSRFQSFFACETLSEAQAFKTRYGNEENPIFEILSSNKCFRGNMNLLNNNRTSLVCSYIAHEYWKGSQGPDSQPFWELLLELPVTVGKQIE